ncbi:MAG TPA: M28 family peptidase [Chitinophagales bacterium]|nr:M28 family peptidase [Chitinophagales bacterium]
MFSNPVGAQTAPDNRVFLQRHVTYLSSDKLEGRLTGSPGEQLAGEYIASLFKDWGIEPKGEQDTYFQSFTFTAGREYVGTNKLTINKINFKPDVDYYALPESGNGTVKGILTDVGFGIDAPDLPYSDFAGKNKLSGKIFLINLSSPDGIHPHSKYNQYTAIGKKIATAVEKGALAIVFYNIDANLSDPEIKIVPKTIAANIPVLFIKSAAYNKVKDNLTKNTKVDIAINTRKTEKTGRNVIGFINNNAPNTVIIGAHYDHLGYGESGGSLHAGMPDIHNGADDNASGVAVLLQLANNLHNNPDAKACNYLFIAFSGEELGLYGSNYYVQHPTVPLAQVNYMLNYDMVGRLDTTTRTLTINGVGTSPQWSVLNTITTGNLHIKTTESGVGPSDHTSFYWQKIPAIHFFTGIHADYHKPADDAEKVNTEGVEAILDYSMSLITTLNKQNEKLQFTPTKTEESQKAPKYKITLGIMPDYAYEGTGIRLTGVIDGRPAQNAGLQAGDVIIKIGNKPIINMHSYMEALSLLKAGDATTIKILRNETESDINITF